MQLIRVENLDVRIKMKPIGVRMKPIKVANSDIEVKMNETGVADPDARVKKKPFE